MRAYEFLLERAWMLKEDPEEFARIETALKKMGHKIGKKGNFIIVLADLPKTNKADRRKKIAGDVATKLSTVLGKPVTYDPDSRKGSSSVGAVFVSKSAFVLLVKDANRQGDNSAGVANEVTIIDLFNKTLKNHALINVKFVDDDGRSLELNNVNRIEGTGKQVKDRKKADVVIFSDKGKLPISIKKVSAETYESADNYFGKTAGNLVRKLVKTKEVELVEKPEPADGWDPAKGPVYELKKEIVVRPTPKQAMETIFGSDINPLGGIIIQDFTKSHYKQVENNVIVDCYAVLKEISDFPPSHVMYFLIRNSSTRNSKAIGIRGIYTAAVTMTRAFGKKLTKNPIFVNQSGAILPKPKPRNPNI